MSKKRNKKLSVGVDLHKTQFTTGAITDEAVEKLRESYDSRMFQVFDVVDQADGSKTITIDADDMYYRMGPITGTISAEGLVVLSHPDY